MAHIDRLDARQIQQVKHRLNPYPDRCLCLRAAGHTPYQPMRSCLTVRLEHLGCQLLMTGQSTNHRLLNSAGQIAFHGLFAGVTFHLSHHHIAFAGD
uniref:Uncharacterized protein n=1 Tax=Klebsiella pneumoniae TaxID=573 RepID=A0A2P1BNF7_KLEPN|nr:hypothetical protein [Klebsiella pneumoniae]